MNPNLATNETTLLREVLQHIAVDLAMISDRELKVGNLQTERMDHRPAGTGQVHISFRMDVHQGNGSNPGCVLIPFVDAVALAGGLLMLPEPALFESRKEVALDGPAKDAMLELGNFIAGATGVAFRELEMPELRVEFSGCQGVKADVRPALAYREGEDLLVAHGVMTLQGFEDQTYVLMLPGTVLESDE
ncbi:MAG: hypothetical protein ACI8QC_002210 [Planctomycetota bacterium]|jgi:hypothetical protein